MEDTFGSDYMSNADPKDRIDVLEQARRGVLANIKNIKEEMQRQDVSDEQMRKLNEEFARADERLRILDKELADMKKMPPRAGSE